MEQGLFGGAAVSGNDLGWTPVTVLKSCHTHEAQNVAQEPLAERPYLEN